jgi:hypothetical protein
MYIPGLITFWYLYVSVKKSDKTFLPSNLEIVEVFINLLITELLYYVSNTHFYTYINFSIFNLIMFFIAQDIYFYSIHYIMHNYLYLLHHKHHMKYGSFYAWYATIPDHVFLNLFSFGIPFYIFNNSRTVFVLLIILQIYTSVNGHTKNSPHSIHHKYVNKRLGSIYLVDRLLGSFN